MKAKTEAAKHTPGPWAAEPCARHKRGHFIVANVGDNRRRIGYSYSDVRNMFVGEEAANARLLAAAPDLLAACEGLLAVCFDYLPHDQQSDANFGPALRAAYAAVNWAKGGAA